MNEINKNRINNLIDQERNRIVNLDIFSDNIVNQNYIYGAREANEEIKAVSDH